MFLREIQILQRKGLVKKYRKKTTNTLALKGKLEIAGVSLTIVESNELIFDVAIIPYTYDNTTFKFIQKGQAVNIEYDIIGKYILKNYSNKL